MTTVPEITDELAEQMYNDADFSISWSKVGPAGRAKWFERLEMIRDTLFVDMPRWVPVPKGTEIKAGQRYMYDSGEGSTVIRRHGINYDFDTPDDYYFIDSRDTLHKNTSPEMPAVQVPAVQVPEITDELAAKCHKAYWSGRSAGVLGWDDLGEPRKAEWREFAASVRDVLFAEVPRWVPLPKGATIKAGQRYMHKSGDVYICLEGVDFDQRPITGGYFIDSRDLPAEDPRAAILRRYGIEDTENVLNELDRIDND